MLLYPYAAQAEQISSKSDYSLHGRIFLSKSINLKTGGVREPIVCAPDYPNGKFSLLQ